MNVVGWKALKPLMREKKGGGGNVQLCRHDDWLTLTHILSLPLKIKAHAIPQALSPNRGVFPSFVVVNNVRTLKKVQRVFQLKNTATEEHKNA